MNVFFERNRYSSLLLSLGGDIVISMSLIYVCFAGEQFVECWINSYRIDSHSLVTFNNFGISNAGNN